MDAMKTAVSPKTKGGTPKCDWKNPIFVEDLHNIQGSRNESGNWWRTEKSQNPKWIYTISSLWRFDCCPYIHRMLVSSGEIRLPTLSWWSTSKCPIYSPPILTFFKLYYLIFSNKDNIEFKPFLYTNVGSSFDFEWRQSTSWIKKFYKVTPPPFPTLTCGLQISHLIWVQCSCGWLPLILTPFK